MPTNSVIWTLNVPVWRKLNSFKCRSKNFCILLNLKLWILRINGKNTNQETCAIWHAQGDYSDLQLQGSVDWSAPCCAVWRNLNQPIILGFSSLLFCRTTKQGCNSNLTDGHWHIGLTVKMFSCARVFTWVNSCHSSLILTVIAVHLKVILGLMTTFNEMNMINPVRVSGKVSGYNESFTKVDFLRACSCWQFVY